MKQPFLTPLKKTFTIGTNPVIQALVVKFKEPHEKEAYEKTSVDLTHILIIY
jgi:hypothetical protein